MINYIAGILTIILFLPLILVGFILLQYSYDTLTKTHNEIYMDYMNYWHKWNKGE